MKKYIFIINFVELVKKLLRGESVEGRLYFDRENNRLTFLPWNRKAPKKRKYQKISDLDGGWLGESDLHIVRYEKFPKSLGLRCIMDLFRRDEKQTLEALVDKDIMDHV